MRLSPKVNKTLDFNSDCSSIFIAGLRGAEQPAEEGDLACRTIEKKKKERRDFCTQTAGCCQRADRRRRWGPPPSCTVPAAEKNGRSRARAAPCSTKAGGTGRRSRASSCPAGAGVRQGELRVQTQALRAGRGAQLTGDNDKGVVPEQANEGNKRQRHSLPWPHPLVDPLGALLIGRASPSSTLPYPFIPPHLPHLPLHHHYPLALSSPASPAHSRYNSPMRTLDALRLSQYHNRPGGLPPTSLYASTSVMHHPASCPCPLCLHWGPEHLLKARGEALGLSQPRSPKANIQPAGLEGGRRWCDTRWT
ncbi:Homeobox protein XHOX-3 [Collichthys lucidus]|uniref:Homeobox protein XHOX-3 n=1 Tax=Collichthys lucidus TaxID=240159 RepID=A0A4U5VUR9_COLLU|nr:Homeobox protein XHOX-3 [Collichthys lucidus]